MLKTYLVAFGFVVVVIGFVVVVIGFVDDFVDDFVDAAAKLDVAPATSDPATRSVTRTFFIICLSIV